MDRNSSLKVKAHNPVVSSPDTGIFPYTLGGSPAVASMDTEREKFRTYIEKSGVMSALTDALVRLYQESDRPQDALAHLRSSLSGHQPPEYRTNMLEEKIKEQQATIESQNAKLAQLEAEVASLHEKLQASQEAWSENSSNQPPPPPDASPQN